MCVSFDELKRIFRCNAFIQSDPEDLFVQQFANWAVRSKQLSVSDSSCVCYAIGWAMFSRESQQITLLWHRALTWQDCMTLDWRISEDSKQKSSRDQLLFVRNTIVYSESNISVFFSHYFKIAIWWNVLVHSDGKKLDKTC